MGIACPAPHGIARQAARRSGHSGGCGFQAALQAAGQQVEGQGEQLRARHEARSEIRKTRRRLPHLPKDLDRAGGGGLSQRTQIFFLGDTRQFFFSNLTKLSKKTQTATTKCLKLKQLKRLKRISGGFLQKISSGPEPKDENRSLWHVTAWLGGGCPGPPGADCNPRGETPEQRGPTPQARPPPPSNPGADRGDNPLGK